MLRSVKQLFVCAVWKRYTHILLRKRYTYLFLTAQPKVSLWVSTMLKKSAKQMFVCAVRKRYQSFPHCPTIPHICHFFTRAKFLENKIYTEKTRKLHSKLPIFRFKSVKIYTGQKKFTRIYSWRSWQIWGMCPTQSFTESEHDAKKWTTIVCICSEEKIYISFPHCPTQSFIESKYNAKKLTTMFFSYHCQHIHFDVDDNVDNQIGCFSLNRAYAQVYWVV